MASKNEETVTASTTYKLLLDMERRFRRLRANWRESYSVPLKQVSNQEINKDKSKEFGEVFTPLCLSIR